MTFLFFINAIGLGIGLAMDAFSVSLANGLHEPKMSGSRMSVIAGIFGGFQLAMPLIGWICVRTVSRAFQSFQRFIPWIALILLAFIGGKMIVEGIRDKDGGTEKPAAGPGALLLQGIATSIDALSVGFTIADYPWGPALVEALLIGVVTFGICMAGLLLGKRFGTRLAGKASILGGGILIAIGLEIFLKAIF